MVDLLTILVVNYKTGGVAYPKNEGIAAIKEIVLNEHRYWEKYEFWRVEDNSLKRCKITISLEDIE